MQTKFHTVCAQITVWNPNPKRICTMVQHKPLHESGDFFKSRPGRKRERIYGAQAQPLGWCRPRGVCLSWQTSQPRRGRSCQPRRGRSCCAQVCAAGGKEQRDQLQGAGGGPGNGSEDGGSNGSDDGAAGRGAVDRQRTPEQVCLSWDSVCTGAPGRSPL